MAGKGERTKEYGDFKPFIEISGKKIAEWFFISIRNNISKDDLLIFITTEFFEETRCFSKSIKELLDMLRIKNEIIFRYTKTTPKGPASTILHARDLINNEQPCLMMNSDQFTYLKIPNFKSRQAFLAVNIDFGRSKSYVSVDNNLITKMVEKENISNIASTGFYGVSSGCDLVRSLDKQHETRFTYNDEYYVAPALNYLYELGYEIIPLPIYVRFDLGTARNLDLFNNFIKDLRL